MQKRKYEVDSTILFTLTTLTTEDVDVSLNDVKQAFEKENQLSMREQISKNMLKAVESIKEKHALDKQYLLGLHKTIMASFEGKTPGRIRAGQFICRKEMKKTLWEQKLLTGRRTIARLANCLMIL
ncbi:hypothetical protein HZB89_01730 [archaeon]|nr:hypothetical protein [archaeon]